MKATLIQIPTADDIILSGLYIPGVKNKPIVIHIHGFESEFYANGFIPVEGIALEKEGMGFLTVQTRGSAKGSELEKTDTSTINIGADYELLEEAKIDIDAWIEFLQKEGHTHIVLQGHSLGTDKVVRYMIEGRYRNDIRNLILLGPFDRFFLIDEHTKGKTQEYVEIAKQRVKEGKGRELVPKEFEYIDLSYQTYASWYTDTEINHMFSLHRSDYDFPILQSLSIPTLIVAGEKDEFLHGSNPTNVQEGLDILTRHIQNASAKIIKNAPHSFQRYENELAATIVAFLKESSINQK